MRILRIVTIVSAALTLVPALVATAQQQPPPTPTQMAEARRLFEQGLELADEERWGEAVEAFARSRAIVERPSTVFNHANALYRVGRMTAAIRAFEEFLGLAHTRRDAELVEEANRLLPIARSSLATLVVQVSPAEARLLLDGEPSPSTGARREIQLDPGSHPIRATADDHEPFSTQVSLEAGQRQELSITLVHVAPPPPPPPSPAVLLVRASVTTARILLDGREIGRGDARREVEAGTHEVEVVAPRHRTHRRRIELAAGTSITLEVDLVRNAPPRAERSGSLLSSPVLWVVTGAVLVGAGVSIGVLVATGGTEDAYLGTTGVGIR